MPRFPLADQICWRDTVHESRMCLLPQGYWPALQIFVEAARTTPPTHEAQRAWSPSATIGPVSRHLSGSFASPRQSVGAPDDAIRATIGTSEERRVGTEGGSTCRDRWSTYHSKKTIYNSNCANPS